MPRLVCAEDRYQTDPATAGLSAPERVVHRHWRHHTGPGTIRGQLRGEWPTAVVVGTRAQAYVNHGRWCVDCPAGCGSAQYASPADRRFFCVDCDGGWYEVDWPADADVEAIERALLARPDPATRNWRPGESVDDLAAENKAHGI